MSADAVRQMQNTFVDAGVNLKEVYPPRTPIKHTSLGGLHGLV